MDKATAMMALLLALGTPAAGHGLAAPEGGGAQAARLAPHVRLKPAPPGPEIRAAIAAALQARNCPAAALRTVALPAADFTPPMPMPSPRPAFRVEAIRADRAQHRTRFRIRVMRAPRLLPFWISLPGDLPARALQKVAVAPQSAGRPLPRRPAGPLLVRPHRPALLTMRSPGMRITLVVIPLQQGRRGQLVRVEDPANHRFMTGTVTGANQLEAEL